VALERRLGQPDEAMEYLERGLEALQGQDTSPAVDTLQWSLADMLIDRGELDEARRHIDELRKAGTLQPATIEFLDARDLYKEYKWNAAATKLEQVRPILDRTPELGKQANIVLGQCYGQLLDRDRELVALHRALAVD